MQALGVTTSGEVTGLLQQISAATQRDGAVDIVALNQSLEMIVGCEPRDTLEAMLISQMVAVHNQAMTEVFRLRSSKELAQHDSHSNAVNKLMRTFTTQIEALKKYRSGGPQRVVVEHKHYHLAAGAISPGSQAVLVDVSQGGGGGVQHEIEHQSHERVHIPNGAAVFSHVEANGMQVPGAGDKRS